MLGAGARIRESEIMGRREEGGKVTGKGAGWKAKNNRLVYSRILTTSTLHCSLSLKPILLSVISLFVIITLADPILPLVHWWSECAIWMPIVMVVSVCSRWDSGNGQRKAPRGTQTGSSQCRGQTKSTSHFVFAKSLDKRVDPLNQPCLQKVNLYMLRFRQKLWRARKNIQKNQ